MVPQLTSTAGDAAVSREPVRLSVVIPVHNGAALLGRCLEALGRSALAPFECIVVDDGCSDDTAAVAARYGATVIALGDRGGPARARNRGAAAARADVLVFLDADVCVHPDTLGRITCHLQDHPATAAVIGSYDDRPTAPGVVSQYKNLLHHYVHQRSRRDAWTFWAGCGAIRRAAFMAAGGFDESYTRPCIEDIELGYRLHRSGARIDLDPSIQVTHLKRWTLVTLVRTDLGDRALPWLLLMMRDRRLPNDLNLRLAHRASVALVWLMMVVAGVALTGARPALVLIAAIATGLLALNFDLYRFFARKRGLAFALASIPLHWFYYWYCGLAVVAVTFWYGWRERTAVFRRMWRWAALRDDAHG